MLKPSSPTYLLASGLRGFPGGVTRLRVRLLATLSDGSLSVITADLADAGTTLVLNPAQCAPFEG